MRVIQGPCVTTNPADATGPGRGIAQWTYPGRWNHLEYFAKYGWHTSVNYYPVQVAFVLWEMAFETEYLPNANAANDLFNARDLYDATHHFMEDYEAPNRSSDQFSKRYDCAEGAEESRYTC